MKQVLALLFFVLFSCNSTEKTMVGDYESKKIGRLNYLFKKYDLWAIGIELQLKNDSSFVISTCGNIASGKWYVKQDTLFLKTLSNKFKIDSLNHLPEWKEQLRTDNKKPIYYLIKKNELYHKGIYYEDGKTKVFMNKLLKK